MYLKNQLSRILIVKAGLLFVLQTQFHNYESKRIKIGCKMSLELRETHNCPCMIFCYFLDAFFSMFKHFAKWTTVSQEASCTILPANTIGFLVINEGKKNVFDEEKTCFSDISFYWFHNSACDSGLFVRFYYLHTYTHMHI